MTKNKPAISAPGDWTQVGGRVRWASVFDRGPEIQQWYHTGVKERGLESALAYFRGSSSIKMQHDLENLASLPPVPRSDLTKHVKGALISWWRRVMISISLLFVIYLQMHGSF